MQSTSTSAALYCTVTVSDGQSVTILFRDQAGALVEADCGFVLLLFNYTSTISAKGR